MQQNKNIFRDSNSPHDGSITAKSGIWSGNKQLLKYIELLIEIDRENRSKKNNEPLNN